MANSKPLCEDFSVLVSHTLAIMGKCEVMVKVRQKYTRMVERHLDMDVIVAGSKGEGLTSYFENDWDAMKIDNTLIGIENTWYCQFITDKTVFRLDTEDTSPGYTRLRLVQLGSDLTYDSLVPLLSEIDTSQLYLSSDKIIEMCRSCFESFNLSPRAGPSNPVKLLDIYSFDMVLAFPCHSPSIMSAWLTRTRSHNWPTQETIRKISTLDAHVVPVGFKGSFRTSEEWRICYTMAELELVRSFTDTQIKLYILLKYLAKEVLSHEFDVMTSYVMKNVMLWVLELTPNALFTETRLIDMLVKSLKLLCMFLKAGFCPCYMIPKRNLFSGKLSVGLRKKLLSMTTELIDEGGGMLLRCERLGVAMARMYKTPTAMKLAGQKRVVFEKVLALFPLFVGESRPEEMSPDWLYTIYDMFSIFMPQMVHGLLQGKDMKQIVGTMANSFEMALS